MMDLLLLETGKEERGYFGRRGVLDDSPKLDTISASRHGRPQRSKNISANKSLGDAPSCPSVTIEDASQTSCNLSMNFLSWNLRGL